MTDACDALIFVLPGGAYEFHADYEAKPVAAWLESLGYSPQVFRYPVAPARYPEALLAVQAAIGAARTTFSGRIGVLGFSAGGHLAGQAALAQPKSWAERADFAGLIYPVVSFGDFGHELSRKNLLGPGPTPAEVSAVSLENLVTADAPPLFIVHTVEDAADPVQNSLRLAESLAEHGARFALHIFPRGPHGIGLGVDSGTADGWPAMFARWLAETIG